MSHSSRATSTDRDVDPQEEQSISVRELDASSRAPTAENKSGVSALEILERTFRPVSFQCASRRESGVYILVSVDQIVYIGASRHVSGRVGSWSSRQKRRLGSVFDWDRAIWMAVPWALATRYEHALIRQLRPIGNNGTNLLTGYDAEILFGLGLRDGLDENDVQWEAV